MVEAVEDMLDLRRQYMRVVKILRQKVRRYQNERWSEYVQVGVSKAIERDHSNYWRWLRTVKGNYSEMTGKPMLALTMPIRDPSRPDRLLTDPEDIARGWALHYGRLAADVAEHSRDNEYWQDVVQGDNNFGRVVNNLGDNSEIFVGLNRELSWSEVVDTIKELANGKASGEDRIPGEWVKCCLCSCHDEEDGPPEGVVVGADGERGLRGDAHEVDQGQLQEEDNVSDVEEGECSAPCNPMSRAFMECIQRIWVEGEVPDEWGTAVLVSIPKKSDDPLDPGNHRGISLISVCLKLLCRVIAKRLAESLERAGILMPEQAGFRSREEAVAQATTLYEILGRRKAFGLKSWVCFLDLKKAYDTVPHEALFEKLRVYGVTGRILHFLKALYANSRMVIESKVTGYDYLIKLERGLRQGCPLSPILFNAYINDVLEGEDEWGIEVPVGDWTARSRRIRTSTRLCRGLVSLCG